LANAKEGVSQAVQGIIEAGGAGPFVRDGKKLYAMGRGEYLFLRGEGNTEALSLD